MSSYYLMISVCETTQNVVAMESLEVILIPPPSAYLFMSRYPG
jgi:hypothetical protein